jgi:cell wall-associated NlpC family hydrolase
MISNNSPALETSDDFASRMVGAPWVDRACNDKCVDCWGLVVLYYRRVVGLNIHHDESYSLGGDFSTCYLSEVCFWRAVEIPSPGDIFVSFIGSSPSHVGLVYGEGKILHARENSNVRFDRMRTLQKLSTRVEFYSYAGNQHPESPRTT